MKTTNSPLEETADLSAIILADLELGRISNHQVLLKCRRLARLVGDWPWQKWLELELHGYDVVPEGISHEDVLAFFAYFGREFDSQKHTGLVHPLNTLEQEAETAKLELEACRVPTSIHASDAKNTYVPDSASRAISSILTRLGEIRNQISARQVIIARVMGSAHAKVLQWYNELHYSSVAQSIFERRRLEVDQKLKDVCPKALEQFVSAYDRLQSGNEEDWSQALMSCRRILKSFADSVFPVRAEPYEGRDGKKHDLADDKYINRLHAFISESVQSRTFGNVIKARLDYICILIAAISDQANKGVHANVSRREADSSVLQTYFLLADLLDFVPLETRLVPDEVKSAAVAGESTPTVADEANAPGGS